MIPLVLRQNPICLKVVEFLTVVSENSIRTRGTAVNRYRFFAQPLGLVVRERLDDLLDSPLFCRVGRAVEGYDLASIMAKHNKAIQDSERGRRYGEEVDGSGLSNMVLEKSFPAL